MVPRYDYDHCGGCYEADIRVNVHVQYVIAHESIMKKGLEALQLVS